MIESHTRRAHVQEDGASATVSDLSNSRLEQALQAMAERL
jgi:hypothetical protein